MEKDREMIEDQKRGGEIGEEELTIEGEEEEIAEEAEIVEMTDIVVDKEEEDRHIDETKKGLNPLHQPSGPEKEKMMRDENKIRYALALIGEKLAGQDWVNAYMRGDLILNTYNDFVEQFKRNFGDPFAKENARLKWKALKQQENQSVGDYNRYFTEVTTLA
ncbi:hypothetical protein BDN72DRAFT_866047, partial [Pluteus cervinus]